MAVRQMLRDQAPQPDPGIPVSHDVPVLRQVIYEINAATNERILAVGAASNAQADTLYFHFVTLRANRP